MQIIALDKTGTITEGQPKVTDIVPADGYTDGSLLSLAHALEAKSEHPLAKAVLKRAEENQMEPEAVTDFKALPGKRAFCCPHQRSPCTYRRKPFLYQQPYAHFTKYEKAGRSAG